MESRKLPRVDNTTVEEYEVKVDFEVPESLVYFEGHFPDFPLVPGVVQVNWVLHFLDELVGVRGDLNKIDVLKFNSMLRPGDRARLEADVDPTEGRVRFEYLNGEDLISSGRLDMTIQ